MHVNIDLPKKKRGFLSRRRLLMLGWSMIIMMLFAFYTSVLEWMSMLPTTAFSAQKTTADVTAIIFHDIKNDLEEVISRTNLYDIPLIVHYVRIYDTSSLPTARSDSVTFSACLSLLSVIENLKPSSIYVHTNYPDFWPFNSCVNVIKLWSPMKFLMSTRTFVMNGTRITHIEHEADLIKFKVVEEYGGLFLDFDVYIVDGEGVRKWLVENPCIACHEGNEVASEGNVSRINAGFFGCLQKHALFMQLVLKESYQTNYHPNEWVFNSGITPLRILEKYPETAVLVDDVCNNPAWLYRDGFNLERGLYNWTDRLAFHSYYKDPSFTIEELQKLNSTLGDMLRWILQLRRTKPRDDVIHNATDFE